MGVSGQRHAPGKVPPVPIVQKAGWAPEPVWTQKLEEKSLLPLLEMEPLRQIRSQTLYWLSYPPTLLATYVNRTNRNVPIYGTEEKKEKWSDMNTEGHDRARKLSQKTQ
jgi:hypothetical protein